MYDARAISNFFIDRARSANLPLTVMTLLKVLYFAHGWFLAKTGNPLVAQAFEAWKYGPVNRVVYEQFKSYGKKPLDKKAASFNVTCMQYVETPYALDVETTKFLENTFDYYVKFHAFELSDLTHQRGGPWEMVWSEAQNRAVPGMNIPNKLILDWFRRGSEVI